MSRYILVGGVPFTGYTGTCTYTSIAIYGEAETREAAEKIVQDKYEEMGGLYLIIDSLGGDDE